MGNSKCRSSILFCFCFFFSSSLFAIQIDAKNQKQALDALYKSKFFKNSNAAVASELFVRSEVPDQNGHDLPTVEIYDQNGLKRQDKIERLPGQPPRVKLSQYGGYVTIDKSAGRAFYYYFVESPHNKNSLPLLLWLNGGTSVKFELSFLTDRKWLNYRSIHRWLLICFVLIGLVLVCRLCFDFSHHLISIFLSPNNWEQIGKKLITKLFKKKMKKKEPVIIIQAVVVMHNIHIISLTVINVTSSRVSLLLIFNFKLFFLHQLFK